MDNTSEDKDKTMETLEKQDLTAIVFEALGEASMCWSETPKGVFESTHAKEIGDRVMEAIESELTTLRQENERLKAELRNIPTHGKNPF